MSRIKCKNTKPELLVRSILHRNGFRFRLHNRKLPGSPDIILKKYKTVIFINGCFWHNHSCMKGRKPSTNSEYWQNKLEANKKRDEKNYLDLKNEHWNVIIIWTCQLSSKKKIAETMHEVMNKIIKGDA